MRISKTWTNGESVYLVCDGDGVRNKTIDIVSQSNKYNHDRQTNITVSGADDISVTIKQSACPWIILGYGQLDLGKLI